ncbi:hypothetical protein DPMN_140214 [Dreissena polymorpha]|uniref:Uncharacterized protein n=1 Tax=Dreissena polymorpha TaxID=45954 RepID=A0A9D4GA21_DREPO|nr:hypothetical protein DPMN_140214 [Dreissena polymorpha]
MIKLYVYKTSVGKMVYKVAIANVPTPILVGQRFVLFTKWLKVFVCFFFDHDSKLRPDNFMIAGGEREFGRDEKVSISLKLYLTIVE